MKNDLTNKTIGTNFVLGPFNKKISNRPAWIVLCRCGKKKILTTYAVKKVQGCKMCSYKGERPYRRKRPYEYMYNTFVNRAKYPVKITYEQYVNLTKQKKCNYCSSEIRWNEYRTKGASSASNLDRKDNSRGYDIDNVVVCCGRCNYAKGSHFTYDEWKKIGKVIKGFKKREYTITPRSGRAMELLQREIENDTLKEK